MHLGQDLSIGFFFNDSENIEIYTQESLTFLAFTAEASVPFRAGGSGLAVMRGVPTSALARLAISLVVGVVTS